MNKKDLKRVEDSMKYFFKMGMEERKCISDWIRSIDPDVFYTKKFLFDLIQEALFKVNYDYYIPTIEPSIKRGKIYYERGQNVAIGMNGLVWEKKAKKFAPEYQSRLANFYELLLWYIYRCAKGYWNISYLFDDSSNAGNYRNSPDSTGMLNLSGQYEVGGYCDGIGNTAKIIGGGDLAVSLVGGNFTQSGYIRPVMSRLLCNYFEYSLFYATGVIVVFPK